jgi:predicted transposase YbfD/YdcC
MNATIAESNLSVPEQDLTFNVGSLMSYLEQVIDPRAARGVRYALVHLLTLLVLAKLGGEDSVSGMAEWVKVRGADLVRLLKLPRPNVPHPTTYERVLDKLDVLSFEQQIGAFFAAQVPDAATISMDGKTLRGTIPDGETQGVHLLAAYSPGQGVVLMQVEVKSYENEISVAPRLLEKLDLRGKIVTGDAIFTQHSLCEQIVEAGGAYILPVKANQLDLQAAIAALFMPPPVSLGHSLPREAWRTAHTVTCQRGRIENRYLTSCSLVHAGWGWAQLAQVFRLQRVVHHQRTGRLTYQVAFGITSLSPERATPQFLLELIRQHWHIENRLHYVRDVTFSEDACRIRQPHRQRLLATLNNLVIGLLRQTPFDFIPQARRYFTVHYHEAFMLLC